MKYNPRMELSVTLTQEQAERLLDDPEAELVLHYSDGTKIFVRIKEEADYGVEENTTVH